MAVDTVTASAKGATFLILLQIGSRALTFALNQVLLRFLSPELLGLAVQLELYIISSHHFARESLRVACQRHNDAGGLQAAINLSYLAVAGGVPITIMFGYWYSMTSAPNVPYFTESLRICGVAAIIELFSEPAFVAVQQNLLYRVRASAEASAVIVKTFATAGLVLYGHRRQLELGMLPFAVGELGYCSTLTIVYFWRTRPVAVDQKFSLFPKALHSRAQQEYILSLFSKPLLNLSLSLYVQSGIKYLLTQGDMIVSTTLASLEDQGMYALSANYGGLIARMVFRPVEDSSRNMFAKLCATHQAPKEDPKDTGKPTSAPSQLLQAATVLRDVLRFYSIASLFAFSIGPSAAPVLLRLVAGSRWADSGAGEVLGIYSYCIPLLAINGVSEAFVAAAASTTELHRQSLWMGLFSVGFAVSAYIFLRVLELGGSGLVLANCVNMTMRIIFNLNFATRFFSQSKISFDLSAILPNPLAIASSAITSGVLAQTKDSSTLQPYGILGELIRIGSLGMILALTIILCERRFLLDCLKNIRR